MKKILTITLLLSFIHFYSQNPNFINNPDFENPNPNNLDDDTRWPDGPAQADKLSSWETRTHKFPSGNTHHSPDWIHKRGSNSMSDYQISISSPPPVAPQSGKGMIGMFNYELIQNYFNQSNPLEAETYHTLSMWVYIPLKESKNCKLRIMFAKSKLKYKSEGIFSQNESDICNQDYITYKDGSNTFTTIHEFDFANLNLASNTWQKITTTFKTPKSGILSQYDFFAMELRKNNYTGTGVVNAFTCNDSYIFIDNLSLVKSSFCSAACAPNLGDIELGNIPNALAQTNSWLFLVKNAIGIKFTIFDSFGHEIDSEEAFDPNGLKDAGFPDYQFGWNSPGLPQDVYNYKLKIWNCGYTKNILGTITIFNNGLPPTTGFNILNFELANCCPLIKGISNTTYTDYHVEAAKDQVFAGYNLGSGPVGNVVVSDGAVVRYVSKNVAILPGFIVNPGGDFKAIITDDCAYQTLRMNGFSKRYFIGSNNADESNSDYQSFGAIKVFPNPSRGIFNITSNLNDLQSIEVYNNLGQLIKTGNKDNNKFVIDLTNFVDGTYIYKIRLNTGEVKNGKLIKNSNSEF